MGSNSYQIDSPMARMSNDEAKAQHNLSTLNQEFVILKEESNESSEGISRADNYNDIPELHANEIKNTDLILATSGEDQQIINLDMPKKRNGYQIQGSKKAIDTKNTKLYNGNNTNINMKIEEIRRLSNHS